MTKSNRRIQSLQGLRAIAFIMILFNHMGVWSASGGIGVAIFFELSGFLMLYNYSLKSRQLPSKIKDCIKFGYLKFRKLYIPYILTGIACFPHMIKACGWLASLGTFVLYSILLQSWVPIKDVAMGFNGVSWFISTQLLMYVMFPFIYRLINKMFAKKENSTNKILVILLVLFFIRVIWRAIFTDWYWPYVFPIFRMLDFISGCLVGVLYLQPEKKQNENLLLILISILTVVGVVEYRYVAIKMMVSGPICLALIYLCAKDSTIISKACTNSLLVYIGNLSMYTYLTHGVVIQYVDYFLGDHFTVLRWIAVITLTWLSSELLKKINNVGLKYIAQMGPNVTV